MLKTIAMISLGLMSTIGYAEQYLKWKESIVHNKRTLVVGKTVEACIYRISYFVSENTMIAERYALVFDSRQCVVKVPYIAASIICDTDTKDRLCINALQIIDKAKYQHRKDASQIFNDKSNRMREVLQTVIGD